jgi:hypothetical protein
MRRSFPGFLAGLCALAAAAAARPSHAAEKGKGPALGGAKIAAGAPASFSKGPGRGQPGPGGEATVRPNQKWTKFRANLEALNARLRGSLPALRTMAAPPPTPTPGNKVTAGGPGAGKSLGALGGGPNPGLGTGGGAGKNLDTVDCTRNPAPSLQRFEGEVTPSGFLLLHGACFGATKGQVFVSGRFPGGALRLAPEDWGGTYAAAVVPDLSGIVDHDVTVKVYVAGKFSNELPARFVARRERVDVPWKYTRNTLCTHQDFCVSDAAHGLWAGHTATNPVEDIDTWHTRLPEGWEFESVSWEPRFLTGGAWVRYAGGAENGPPNDATWNMRWRSSCESGGTVGDACFVGYRLHVAAWGPAGTLPP